MNYLCDALVFLFYAFLAISILGIIGFIGDKVSVILYNRVPAYRKWLDTFDED